MATKEQSMANMVRTSLVLQGILAILFGIAAVFWPGMTAVTLVYLFSAFILIDGIVVMILGLMHLNNFSKALLMLLLGVLELGIGVYLIRNPLVSFATLILLLGFALIIRGLFGLVGAFVHKEDSAGSRALAGIMGSLGILVGIIILAQPVAGGIAFVWMLGLYALISGPIFIALSFDVVKTSRR